jgi:preprotein translocase subunit SecA
MIETAPSSPLPVLVYARQFLRPRASAPRRADWRLAREVLAEAARLRDQSDASLAGRSRALRELVASGARPADTRIVVAGFALVSEAFRRCLAVDLYEEQLLAGLVLTRRAVAQMQTGEGKTYAAALPAFVHALTGAGVHVVTVNDYLADRDCQTVGPVLRLLGLSVGLLRSGAPAAEKRDAYACDVTYGVDQEFGFDYLRDQLHLLCERDAAPGSRLLKTLRGCEPSLPHTVQRQRAAAIVDEIDCVLLDSSTSPLLLSQSPENGDPDAVVYGEARQAAAQLVAGEDYVVEPDVGHIAFTAAGAEKISAAAKSGIRSQLQRPWAIYVEQALRARDLLRRDVHYLVRDGKVLLVDEYTGRILPEQNWQDGLHQAVEVKEGLRATFEHRSAVRISKQRYFHGYRHLCGMTGTAQGSEREFWSTYRLPVVLVPLRKPSRRKALATRFFASRAAKHAAITAEVARLYRLGQPVLVGTRTIDNSESLARQLDARGIPYQLLNGKQDQAEARIVARAGEVGMVTIATNMAGRGTDIRLGPGGRQLGGLHVIGVECHESARIDRQLAGRSARQGDPGCYQFFVSAEDPLLVRFSRNLATIVRQAALPDGESDVDFSHEVLRLQRRVEKLHCQARHRLFRHDDWLKKLLARWSDAQ